MMKQYESIINAAYLNERGVHFLKTGNYQDATSLFTQALKLAGGKLDVPSMSPSMLASASPAQASARASMQTAVPAPAPAPATATATTPSSTTATTLAAAPFEKAAQQPHLAQGHLGGQRTIDAGADDFADMEMDMDMDDEDEYEIPGDSCSSLSSSFCCCCNSCHGCSADLLQSNDSSHGSCASQSSFHSWSGSVSADNKQQVHHHPNHQQERQQRQQIQHQQEQAVTFYDDSGFVDRSPIAFLPSPWDSPYQTKVRLCVTTIYNYALTFHLGSSIESESYVSDLYKAIQLYELACRLHMQSDLDMGWDFRLKVVNNLGHAYRLLGDDEASDENFQDLLSCILYLHYSSSTMPNGANNLASATNGGVQSVVSNNQTEATAAATAPATTNASDGLASQRLRSNFLNANTNAGRSSKLEGFFENLSYLILREEVAAAA